FFLLVLAVFYSCEKNEINECFGKIYLNETIFLNNPEFNNLIISPGWVTTSKGMRNIIILKYGIENPIYTAFDLECPNHDCPTPMTYDGSFLMICSCDQSKYRIIDGNPQNNSAKCSAYQYNVRQTSSSTLIITGS
ncbi:MAG: hypothetical protein P1P79_06340, partial [Lutibacter sp.]|nr:hypothetical protein [Lutibacter sp.]